MINRLLVANRAEIASRVFRTCRALGIETVAVHSDADADLPYVAEADAAVRLPGHAPAETYLRSDLVLEAARAAGADAIHPGYGFLSENADFARAVEAAGLTWVGPAPESIEQMGSKIESKKLMEAAGVPVLTNHGVETATEADLPLIVKASAGGGGRGMRIVRTLADLPGEVAKATAEAESAFGDGTVFIETYVERGRHVEVQVLGDGRGGAVAVGERDCSLQRRHQKVVEESPAPGLAPEVAAAMHAAAVAAAQAIDYRGAGTVEFLYDPDTERFFFLEMNTRLQVEHPVTELVHGLDLVDQQLAIAEGGDLPEVAASQGHAIEVRLYAEDPAADYQPQSGLLTRFEIPGAHGEEPGVRVDSGFATGSVVSTHYDAMLAKVVVHAATREAAARRLAGMLSRARIHGLVTNRTLLVAALRDPDFLAGRISTRFLDEHPGLFAGAEDDPGAPVAAALALAERARTERTVQHGAPVAWRNVVAAPQRTELRRGGEHTEPVLVEWRGGRDGFTVEGCTVVGVSTGSTDGCAVTLERDGVRTTYDVTVSGPTHEAVLDVDSPRGHLRLVRVPRFTDPADAVASGSLLAPMPGSVIKVLVAQGDAVSAGQPVLVLEAMKMQHTVSAPTDGVVTQLDVQPGAQVASGEVLAVVEEQA
ncbi:Acetyl-/propionyl-coenzyme A carboxylase alpha chain [Nocardioides dokdonensis FR1436]|uniref:Acetyl-/propionyl-coenzyme A carboxylase alpha chain n=1 Tax=Nocardioides dokdonensis FR1436 TaxID=1300347 RepID=A0A1A9GJ96_9ACTN|nr:biotin carboxylase N-terminal domain-containing protein [Nocardioides dokdonensis]ANH37535.1 Acetyl-/propionyl-coenzyme A carboxylase alpha chain [Nocardioides dokdonensis FR1436]